MRLRKIILILALFAFLSALVGGILYYYTFRAAAFKKSEIEASVRLKLLTDQLSSYLSEHIKPVKTLSNIKELHTVFKDTNLESISQANKILDNFTKSLDLEVSYLMDKNGVTLCSSNRNAKDSFVEKNFAFRPYFEKAIQGIPATYLALGTTSEKRGVYYSHPVYDKNSAQILGVVVIKASVEFVETKLFSNSDDSLIFLSPGGIIFISNKDSLRFKFLWQPDQKNIDTMMNSKQFGNGPWAWSGFTKDQTGYVTDKNSARYLFTSYNVVNYPGWKTINLRNYKEIAKQVSKPFVKVIGPVVISILLLTGILIMLLYQSGIKEIIKRKQTENKLKISEKRYRHIYHKTPVMLHSIDPEGRIIMVSDHWVDVLGYKREDIIGRKLTSFFTKESKKYAENVIFPKFFTTGFSKDISYTFIKANSEKMDVLLSCYGVRDEDGKIKGSLAVSVDVTEKNQTQKALQVAKEKLSQYSQDLEQQVKKRTAQLENAQDSLKNLSKNIIASQEREKAQVAGELHDHLGQVLTALRIDAVWAEKFLNRIDGSAANRVKKMCSLIDDTIDDVREMAYRLRPRVLDELGLTDALELLLLDFEKKSNVSCVFKHDGIPDISNTLATALYRIAQEAVTNALRHSNATTITLELTTDEEGIILSIQDNGCGLDVDNKENFKGFGIEGMKERALLVGGKLEIVSELSGGTKICCKVKLKRKKDD
ncbi:MAG: PAS domain-containing protein [Thermodesulfobacteriota bacterium]